MKPSMGPTGGVDSFDYESALAACVRGDPEALRAVYDREARWLLGVALRIVRDRETAHDVLQDAFLQIWQRAGSYRRELGSARGWIYTVVRHRALDEVRRVGREIAVGDEIEAYAETQLGADHPETAAHADVGMLNQCLGALDERKRECILYAFVEGYTHEQISNRLSTPVGTVKSWIRRGLISLKECLS